MKAGILLGKLAQKAGLDTTTEEWKAILTLDNDLPAEAATKIDTGLLSLEAAKNNPEVTKAIKAQVLAGADARMDSLITDLGFTVGDDFANEKNTYEKIAKLTKLALDAGKKVSGTGSKQTADEFAAKEKAYNDEIKSLKDGLKNKEIEFSSTRENDLTNFELQKLLFGKDYVFPKEMDSNVKVNTALSVVQNELAKKGFTFKKNESGQLAIVNKDGAPAYGSDNVALEPNNFIDGVLTQNKLLRINDSGAAGNASGSGTHVIPANGGAKNTAIVNEIDRQLAELPN